MRPNKTIIILLLGMLTAIGPFSIDMYLPAFALMAGEMETTVAHISMSLSSFFIGISIGQLFYGPILDKFGRKKPLYFGLALYFLASLLCVFTNTADQLIFLRFFQAVGGCAGMVASRALVRDMFAVQESAKVFSKLMLVVGVSPIIAPTLGGYLSAHFGWHSIFVVLAAMSVIILTAIHFILPNTHRGNPQHSLKPGAIITGYGKVLREPQFFTYAFTGAIGASGLYAFIAGSPEVFLKYFKVSEQGYGGIFALVASGLILSSQVNSVLLRKYSSAQIIRTALLIQCITGIIFYIASVTHVLTLTRAIVFILLFLSCQGFCFPNSSALSMAPFSKNAGSASALMGAIQMSFGAMAAALVGAMGNNTAIPMAAGMACCTIGSYMVLMVDGRIVRYKPSEPEVQEETIDGFINAGQ